MRSLPQKKGGIAMRRRFVVAAAVVVSVVWLGLGGCGHGGGPPAPPAVTAAYVGAAVCKNCHSEKHADWAETGHAEALEALQRIGQASNPECLPCHTVGFGQPSGFVSEGTTPELAGVQCESCHGPGSEHVAAGGDESKIIHGAEVLKAEVCGRCHTGAHQPTFEEWEQSPHKEAAELLAEEIASFAGREAFFGERCAPCHSGEWRAKYTEEGEAPEDYASAVLGLTQANLAITCAVCHDPHEKTSNNAEPGEESQLRHKQALTGDIYAGGNPTDVAVYTTVNHICGECHNRRGADPADAGLQTSTSRPPHHSPQLDFLLGEGGVEIGGSPGNSAHSSIPEQCSRCHMYAKEFESAESPAVTGHAFYVNYKGCAPCHSEGDAGIRSRSFQTKTDIEQRLNDLRNRLNSWGNWEYTANGGPSSGDQAAIPIEIKRARYNYYYVLNEGSLGVHNARYARYLIDVANRQLDALGVHR